MNRPKSYAKATKVPVHRSRGELEILLERYGAASFAYAREGNHYTVAFRVSDRMVRMEVTVPEVSAFGLNGAGRRRTSDQAVNAHAQEERRLWRALVLLVKAKLEAVESGISTVEREFLADIVLPDGARVGEWLQPQLAASYQGGPPPTRLLLSEGNQ